MSFWLFLPRLKSFSFQSRSKKYYIDCRVSPPVNPPIIPPRPDMGHQPGGLPMISDSAFSLVTLIYVSIAFLFVFFMFCWRTTTNGGPSKNGEGGAASKAVPSCPLMTLPEDGQTKCQNGGKNIINSGPAAPNHVSSDCPTILRLVY